jgi:hypothetical protein
MNVMSLMLKFNVVTEVNAEVEFVALPLTMDGFVPLPVVGQKITVPFAVEP